jgi:hypothetical protein
LDNKRCGVFLVCGCVFSPSGFAATKGAQHSAATRKKKTENTKRNDELSPVCALCVLPEGLWIVTFSLIR